MRVLLVKMSSLGDVVHSFPAVTDLLGARPDVELDWVVEEGYADLVRLHPGVSEVHAIGFRRWRRRPWQDRAQWRAFVRMLRSREYDLIVDAQGLLKSALITRIARGRLRAGPDRHSARESLAALAYARGLAVPRDQHAIDRTRQLLALAADYALPDSAPDFGLALDAAATTAAKTEAEHTPAVVFLHGTSWDNKLWPEAYWQALTGLALEAGYRVLLPSGDAVEQARADIIAAGRRGVEVLPPGPLGPLSRKLASAAGVVTVDTGLGHLAAALNRPTVALYGPTDAGLTGIRGPHAISLQGRFPCAPCLQRRCTYSGPQVSWQGTDVEPACLAQLRPDQVWSVLSQRMDAGGHGQSALRPVIGP
jgi:heptosyltransferase I